MWYAVYRQDGSLQSTGSVEPISADIDALGWFYKSFNYNIQARDKQWNTTTLDFDTITVPKSTITISNLKKRFTDDEYIEVIKLAKTNDQVGAYIDILNTETAISPDDEKFTKFITFLTKAAAGNILTTTRATEILS